MTADELASAEERRLFERISARLPAKIKDTRENFGERIYLRDASAQGARFLSKDRLYLNDSVSVDVQMQGSYPLTVRGSVVWVHKEEEDHWSIGLKFHKIRFMQLSRLIEKLSPPEAGNIN